MTGFTETSAIIEIGAEGGSITVVARTGDGGSTEFSVRMRDQTLTLLSEDEAGPEIRRDSAWSERWEDVVASLGRWPWPMLVPQFVHADYRDRILMAVKNFRGRDGKPARESAVERWAEACLGSEGK